MFQEYSCDQIKEDWQPLPNVAPNSLKNKVFFWLRLIFDFGVLTTRHDIKKWKKSIRNNVLEIGCGLQPYRHLIPSHIKYYAIDWKNSNKYFHYKVNEVIYYEGDIFPLKDETFNSIFHTEVLEHIYDLNQFLSECYRVLTKNGEMFFTIPFAARYHYIPNDYWRLTPAAIKKLLENAQFKNIVIRPHGNDITVVITKLNAIFYRVIFKKFNNCVFRIINTGLFGIIFSIPIIMLTIIGHLSIFMNVGSPHDPLAYAVYCNK